MPTLRENSTLAPDLQVKPFISIARKGGTKRGRRAKTYPLAHPGEISTWSRSLLPPCDRKFVSGFALCLIRPSITVMVELRKRKTPPPAAEPSKKSAASSKKRATSKSASSTPAPVTKPAKEEKKTGKAAPSPTSISSHTPKIGDTLPLEELKSITVRTNNEEEVTLSGLLEKSPDKSIALFTYPKASTPGCTNQACLFRDSYEELTPSLEVYGLSNDSPKSNTTFKEKQKLPYTLLCDPTRELINKLGFGKAGGSTARGVIVVGKDGKIAAWTLGGPQPTLDAVKAVMNKEE